MKWIKFEVTDELGREIKAAAAWCGVSQQEWLRRVCWQAVWAAQEAEERGLLRIPPVDVGDLDDLEPQEQESAR